MRISCTCLMVATLLGPHFCLAQSNRAADLQFNWNEVAASDAVTYSLKADSYQVGKSIGGAPAVAFIVRARNAKTNEITLNKKYVLVKDCVAGNGKLITTDLDGTFSWETPFAFGAGDVASTIALSICGIHAKFETQE